MMTLMYLIGKLGISFCLGRWFDSGPWHNPSKGTCGDKTSRSCRFFQKDRQRSPFQCLPSLPTPGKLQRHQSRRFLRLQRHFDRSNGQIATVKMNLRAKQLSNAKIHQWKAKDKEADTTNESKEESRRWKTPKESEILKEIPNKRANPSESLLRISAYRFWHWSSLRLFLFWCSCRGLSFAFYWGLRFPVSFCSWVVEGVLLTIRMVMGGVSAAGLKNFSSPKSESLNATSFLSSLKYCSLAFFLLW